MNVYHKPKITDPESKNESSDESLGPKRRKKNDGGSKEDVSLESTESPTKRKRMTEVHEGDDEACEYLQTRERDIEKRNEKFIFSNTTCFLASQPDRPSAAQEMDALNMAETLEPTGKRSRCTTRL